MGCGASKSAPGPTINPAASRKRSSRLTTGVTLAFLRDLPSITTRVKDGRNDGDSDFHCLILR